MISFVWLLFQLIQPSLADASFYQNKNISLIDRKNEWPNWKIRDSLFHSYLTSDLFYPEWFEGEWAVESFDLSNQSNYSVKHKAVFKSNTKNKIIADRNFNSQSLIRATFNDDTILVKLDPKTINRQFTFLDNNNFLDTKIIYRKQENVGIKFFTDEIAMQIFHSSNPPRLTYVETLTEFQNCFDDKKLTIDNSLPVKICAEQWQVIYHDGKDFIYFNPLKANHYQMVLKRL